MSEHAGYDRGYDVERYFDLVARGLLGDDDQVELLEGLVVASPPQNPLHGGVTMRVEDALRRATTGRAALRVHLPLIAGVRSAPEPDVALVPGGVTDYDVRHPDRAFLVVEIADSSLAQDGLTKSRIYAHAGIPEYWIVNLRSRCVEIFRDPDPDNRVYRTSSTVERGAFVELSALPGAVVAVADLVPGY